MTITRETLELAALAAGHKIYGWCVLCDDRIAYADIGPGEPVSWRPHLDDGDAARLAVRLNVMMDADQSGYCHAIHGLVDTISIAHDGTEPGKLRAWREAVVLCAAAVGERMQQLAKRTNATPEQVAWSLAAVDEYDAAKRGER